MIFKLKGIEHPFKEPYSLFENHKTEWRLANMKVMDFEYNLL